MIDKLDFFRDPNFKFNPDSHEYTYLNPDTGRPVQIFESVSGFCGQFKTPFEADKIAGFVARKRKVDKQSILDEWEAKKVLGQDLGSITHDWIEHFYKGVNPPLPVNESELKQIPPGESEMVLADPQDIATRRILKFKSLHEQRLHKLNIVDQELRIFSRKWGIAGTLDALFEMIQSFYVGDWKTNKDFTHDDHKDGRRQRLLYPFDDLWDNSLNGYSIQVSTYRLILEEEAGFVTDGGFLAWLGPDDNKPQMFKTLDLRDRIYSYLEKNNFGF